MYCQKIKPLKRIENSLIRNVTFCKRKKGIIKKAMELSQLCDQEVALFIYDKTLKRFISFTSTENI